MKQLILNALALLAVGLILSSCNKSKGSNDPVPPTHEQEVPPPQPGPYPNPQPGPQPQPTGRVCFFQFPNYQGQAFCLVPGQEKSYLAMRPMRGQHALVRSILVQGNARAIFYASAGFQGPSILVKRGIPDTSQLRWRWHGPAASVKVVHAAPPQRDRRPPNGGPTGPDQGEDENDNQGPDDNAGPQRPPRRSPEIPPRIPQQPDNDDNDIPEDDGGPYPDEEQQGPDDNSSGRDNRNNDRDTDRNNDVSTNGGSGRACFFSDPGFKGHSFCLEAGAIESDLPNIGWGGVISSISIEGGVSVSAYLKEDHAGEAKVIQKSTSDLSTLGGKWNDSIASVKVGGRR